MDLASLDTTIKSEQGVKMELRHPTNNTELGVILTLRGTDSKIVKAAFSKFKRINDDLKKSDPEKDRASVEFLTMCITDIENAEYDGKPIGSDAEGIKFFINRFQWAAAQVFEFINDLDNFLPDSDNS